MTKTNSLILAASDKGRGSREYPGYLSEMDGICLLEKIAHNVHEIPNCAVRYAFLSEDVKKYRLANITELISPQSSITKLPNNTKGAACTAMLAAADFSHDEELLIVSANEFINADLSKLLDSFRNAGFDAATLTFQSVHPRYSYVRVEDGLVRQASQCEPISRNATTGLFWFRRVGDFMDAIKSAIRKDAHYEGQYYVAPLFNELILKGCKVGALPIETRNYMPLKSEKQITAFEIARMESVAL